MRQSRSPRFHLHFRVAAAAQPAARRGGRQGRPATPRLWGRIEARLTSILPVIRAVSTREWRQLLRHSAHHLVTHHHRRRDSDRREVARIFRSVRVPARPLPGAPIGAAAAAQPAARRGGRQGRPATPRLWRRIEARLTSILPVVRAVSTREWRQPLRHSAHHLVTHHHRRRDSDRREVARIFRSVRVPARPLPGAPFGAAAAATPLRGRLPRAPVDPLPSRRRPPSPVRLDHKLPRPIVRGAEPGLPASRAAAPLRPPELVWRVEADEPPAEAVDRPVRVAAASAPLAPAPASGPAPAAAEALRPRLLDPALIDRVAEDVIGRVERRIRIERERRGV